jgi:sec-independent protein translocase protein TatB
MFGIGAGELLTLTVLAFILIGPDRLPHVAKDAAKLVKRIRVIANTATAELRENLGPGFEDLQVSDLHPKKLIKKTLGTSFDDVTSELTTGLTLDKKKAQIDPDLL